MTDLEKFKVITSYGYGIRIVEKDFLQFEFHTASTSGSGVSITCPTLREAIHAGYDHLGLMGLC